MDGFRNGRNSNVYPTFSLVTLNNSCIVKGFNLKNAASGETFYLFA